MAIASSGNQGVAADFTSSDSWLPTAGANVWDVDQWLIAVLAIDNVSITDGDNSDVLSFEGESMTWSKLAEYTNGQGGIGAGCTVSAWMARNTSGSAIGTVDFSINFSGNVGEKVLTTWRFTAGPSLALVPGSVQNTALDASANFGSATISGLPSIERLYFRALAKEVNSTAQITTSANFNAITAQRSRNNAAAVIARGEWRINTSTGETSNPTFSPSGDLAGVFFALSEGEPAAGGMLRRHPGMAGGMVEMSGGLNA